MRSALTLNPSPAWAIAYNKSEPEDPDSQADKP
jgi:hypothetical protein